MLRDADLVESILQVDVSKDGIVRDSINVESDVG